MLNDSDLAGVRGKLQLYISTTKICAMTEQAGKSIHKRKTKRHNL